MSAPNKLTIEEAEKIAITRCDDASRIARQLANTMLENQDFREALTMIAKPALDSKLQQQVAQLALKRNKHSEADVRKLSEEDIRSGFADKHYTKTLLPTICTSCGCILPNLNTACSCIIPSERS